MHKVISNRNINLSAHRHLLLSVIRPNIEYGSEVWEGNKSQAGSLESIILDGAKRILGCSSKTCNEAVRGHMGLDQWFLTWVRSNPRGSVSQFQGFGGLVHPTRMIRDVTLCLAIIGCS